MTIKWYLDNQQWMEEIISGEYMEYYEAMYSNKLTAVEEAIVVSYDEVAVTKDE